MFIVSDGNSMESAENTVRFISADQAALCAPAQIAGFMAFIPSRLDSPYSPAELACRRYLGQVYSRAGFLAYAGPDQDWPKMTCQKRLNLHAPQAMLAPRLLCRIHRRG